MIVCSLAGSGCGGTRQTLTATETFQYLSSPSFPSQYPRYISAQHRTAKEQYSLMQLVTKNEFISYFSNAILTWVWAIYTVCREIFVPGYFRPFCPRFQRVNLRLDEFHFLKISLFKCSLNTCCTIEKEISVNYNITTCRYH